MTCLGDLWIKIVLVKWRYLLVYKVAKAPDSPIASRTIG